MASLTLHQHWRWVVSLRIRYSEEIRIKRVFRRIRSIRQGRIRFGKWSSLITGRLEKGKKEIPVQKVEGLVVQRLDKQTVVELPKVYSRGSIPARRNQIPTPEIASKWQHLTKIKDEIPSIQHDVEVSLLIGCNCPKALKPQEVILGNDNDPYAVKTKLGWGIIGPVSPSSPVSR